MRAGFPVLLWVLSLSVLAETDRFSDVTPETIELQAPGVVVRIPLDLTVMVKAAVFEMAASFASMLPEVMNYAGYHQLEQVGRNIGQWLGVRPAYSKWFYYYSFLLPWVAENFSPGGRSSEIIPPAPVSTITSPAKPPLQPGSYMHLTPAFYFEKSLYGGLSALLGYLAELSESITTVNQSLVSFDKVASFSVLQNDNDQIRLFATILDAKNTAHNFTLGRHKEMFWIERFNQHDMTSDMRVAWSISSSNKQAARLSVQLPPLVELANPGKLLEINIPARITERVLTSGTKKALGAFSELMLNWQLPKRLSYAFSGKPGTGSREFDQSLLPKRFVKTDDFSLSNDVLQLPVTFLPESHAKSVPISSGQEEASGSFRPSSEPHQDRHKDNDRSKKRRDEQEGDDHSGNNGGNAPSSQLPGPTGSGQGESSLLWQATEAFHSGSNVEISLEQAFGLMRDLSSVGMVQILPTDGVEMSHWPLVMSQPFADFLKLHLNVDEKIVGDPLPESEYVVGIGQGAFDQIVKHNEEVTKLIDVRRSLYSAIEKALKKHCGVSGHCYFGGEQVRRFIKDHNFGHKVLYKHNLPVSVDVDVLLPYTQAEEVIKRVSDELESDELDSTGLTDLTVNADTRSPMMAFSFSEARPDLHFNHYKLGFSSKDYDTKFLPGLDFAIASKNIDDTFLSPEAIIYESIKRGCGPTTDCRSKHLDRLRLLNTLFPSISIFSDLRTQIIPVRLGEAEHLPDSGEDTFDELHSRLTRKDEEIVQIKSAANERLNTAKNKITKVNEKLTEFEKQNKLLLNKLTLLQQVFDSQRKELVESQNNNKERSEMMGRLQKQIEKNSLLQSDWESKEKELQSDISKIEQSLNAEKKEKDKLRRSNKELNNQLKTAQQEHQALLSSTEEKQVNQDESVQILTENNKRLWAIIHTLQHSNGALKATIGMIGFPSIVFVVNDLLKRYYRMTPAVCGQLNYKYSKNLCSVIEGLDVATLEIIKAMDQMTGRHRVVKYKVNSLNVNKGLLTRYFSDHNIDVLRKGIDQSNDLLLLVHESHTYWEIMNTDELAQIVLALGRGLTDNARKPVGTLEDYIQGTIAYCGYMPNERWQRECTDRALDRIFTRGFQPEEFSTVKIDEPDLQPGKRYIAFLPVWDVSGKRMTWHNVWPYRLDSNGYHLLGNSNQITEYNYKCDMADKEVYFRYFNGLKWAPVGMINCNGGANIHYTNVRKDVVFWLSYYKNGRPYAHQAESYDDEGSLSEAWKNLRQNTEPSM